MNKIIIVVAAAATLAGCLSNRRADTSDLPPTEDQLLERDVTEVHEYDIYKTGDGHTAANSLDYIGTYRGVLPCADCEGIETTVTLGGDGNYRMSTRYLGKGDGRVFESSGAYRWDDDGTRIRLDGGDGRVYRYFVGEGMLRQLDLEGNRIEGDLAEHYILRKTD
ncbi:MAG: copper resistance protein NlpE N-terminal domain-containing protein [Rikenellaceae bacterium]|nr:copper resistance protein NlpE N-terminal domain-containing protein [Rikenellaceae bacterium]